VGFLLHHATADEGADHEALLRAVFAQVPRDVADLEPHLAWAVGRGHLLKAVRATLWERAEDAEAHLAEVARGKAQADEPFLRAQAHRLLDYEAVFGAAAARKALARLGRVLARVAGRSWARRLGAQYWAGRAFVTYEAGDYASVPAGVVRAVLSRPQAAGDRGLLAILLRSMARRAAGQIRRGAWRA
jgi:hypothetical protein